MAQRHALEPSRSSRFQAPTLTKESPRGPCTGCNDLRWHSCARCSQANRADSRRPPPTMSEPPTMSVPRFKLTPNSTLHRHIQSSICCPLHTALHSPLVAPPCEDTVPDRRLYGLSVNRVQPEGLCPLRHCELNRHQINRYVMIRYRDRKLGSIETDAGCSKEP